MKLDNPVAVIIDSDKHIFVNYQPYQKAIENMSREFISP